MTQQRVKPLNPIENVYASPLRVHRLNWLADNSGSINRILFDLPNGDKAELTVTFNHCGDDHMASCWENDPWGKLNEISAIHSDEIFGLYSGCSDPDLGIEKLDALLSNHIEQDFYDWTEILDHERREAEKERQRVISYYRWQKGFP